jgi:hypothetical protein
VGVAFAKGVATISSCVIGEMFVGGASPEGRSAGTALLEAVAGRTSVIRVAGISWQREAPRAGAMPRHLQPGAWSPWLPTEIRRRSPAGESAVQVRVEVPLKHSADRDF